MARTFTMAAQTGLVCGMALSLVAASGAVPVVVDAATSAASAAIRTAASTDGPQRLAFTDDRDRIEATSVTRTRPNTSYAYSVGDPVALPAVADVRAARHTGEMSSEVGGTGTYAFIRTAPDNPAGDVYVALDGQAPFAITCHNTAIESHPVVSIGEGVVSVAYAADSGHGDDLWVSFVSTGESSGDRCATPRVQVTDDAHDDMWPAWLPDGARLAFSSTRYDPLGDIFLIDVPPLTPSTPSPAPTGSASSSPSTSPAPSGAPAASASASAQPTAPSVERGLRRLTTGAAAETQPAVSDLCGCDYSQTWVAFTTTQFRPDGSLATLAVPSDDTTPAVTPLWPNGDDRTTASPWTPQSSEAQWSPGGAELLFTSTQDDPYGDVFLTPVEAGDYDVTVTGLLPRDPVPVAATPGVAETHGAWVQEFLEDDVGDSAVVGFTVRAQAADVSDVVAADGTSRRVLASSTGPGTDGGSVGLDDSGPTYSPDGTQIAFSSETSEGAGSSTLVGHRLMRAASDGSGAAALAYSRQPGDVDVDPTWSPDGSRVAFVRYRASVDGSLQAPRIWVVNVSDGVTTRLSHDPPAGQVRRDVDPTWSPDSNRLAFSRQVRPVLDASITLSATPTDVTTGATTDLTVTVAIAEGTGSVRVDLPISRLSLPDTLPSACERGSGGVVCHLDGVDSTGRVLVIPVTTYSSGTFPVRATVTADGDDPVPGNNSAEATVTAIDPVPIAHLTMSVAPSSVVIGSAVTVSASTTVTDATADVTLTVPVPTGLTLQPSTTLPDGCVRQPADTPTHVECALSAVSTAEVVRSFPLATTAEGTYTFEGTATPLGGAAVTSRSGSLSVGPVIITMIPSRALGAAARTSFGPLVAMTRLTQLALSRLHGAAHTSSSVGRRHGAGPIEPPVTADPSPEPWAPPQLWTMSATDGTGEVLLTEPPGACPSAADCTPAPLEGRSPAWSPDGTRIAFERDGALRLASLAVAATAGHSIPEQVTSLTQVTGILPDGTPTSSRAVLSVTQDPAWSPDGTQLATSGQPAGQPDQHGIYALAPDGTGLREVVQGRGPETEPVIQPVPARTADLTMSVTLSSAVGWVGGQPVTATFTVHNNGPAIAEAVVLTTTTPPFVTTTVDAACPANGSPCSIGTVPVGATRVVTSSLAPAAAGTGPVTGSVATSTSDPAPVNNAADAALTVLQPTLTVLPEVTRPGNVVLATGTDFPPGAQVTLTWSVGVTTQPAPFATADDGTITHPVLIVRHDQLGGRTLVATSPTGQFAPIEAAVLVAARSMSPPGFLGRG